MNAKMETGTGRRWKTVAGFALLAAAMGVLQWNWFAMPLERDEGEYAYAAWLMRTGKGVPYRDSFLQKPPMIVYTYGLVEALAPGSDKVGFRVAGFLASLATAWLVWGIGRREFGGRAGALGAWLWVAFAHQLMFAPMAANAEKFMAAPMLGALAAAGRGERRWWRWALAGALAGAAVLYKPICAPVLGAWFLWAVFARGGQRTGASPRTPGARPTTALQEAGRRLGWVALGGVAAGVAGVVWFAGKGALGELWECAAEYTGEYAKLSGNPWKTALQWWSLFGTWKLVLMAALAGAGAASRWREARVLAVLSVVSAAVSATGVNGHYHLMTLPLAAMLAGAGVERAAGRWGGAATVVAVAALLGTGDEWRSLWLSPETLCRRLYAGNPFAEAAEAGRLAAAACPEEGTVHVVGSEPEILWYARRKGTTRFDIAYPLTLPTRLARGYQQEALEAIRREPPSVLVFATTPLGGVGAPELQQSYLGAIGRMFESGEYRLSQAFMPGQGWVEGGDWRRHFAGGMTLGVFVKSEMAASGTGVETGNQGGGRGGAGMRE